VSPGGEEFTSRLKKSLHKEAFPNFMHGTLRDLVEKGASKPILLYLSGETDVVSRKFESHIVTKQAIIKLMVTFFLP
jgi:hypothetical protein